MAACQLALQSDHVFMGLAAHDSPHFVNVLYLDLSLKAWCGQNRWKKKLLFYCDCIGNDKNREEGLSLESLGNLSVS